MKNSGFFFLFFEFYAIMFQCGSVAQLVEQRPEEPCVVGSSPTGATKKTHVGLFLYHDQKRKAPEGSFNLATDSYAGKNLNAA